MQYTKDGNCVFVMSTACKAMQTMKGADEARPLNEYRRRWAEVYDSNSSEGVAKPSIPSSDVDMIFVAKKEIQADAKLPADATAYGFYDRRDRLVRVVFFIQLSN